MVNQIWLVIQTQTHEACQAGGSEGRRSGRTAGMELGKGPPRPSGGEIIDRDRWKIPDDFETKGTPKTCGRPAVWRQGDEQMTEPRKIARYGWIPDLPDERDHIYAAPPQF